MRGEPPAPSPHRPWWRMRLRAAGTGAQLPRQPPGRRVALIFNNQQALPMVPVAYVQGQGWSLQPPTFKVINEGNRAVVIQFVLSLVLFLTPRFCERSAIKVILKSWISLCLFFFVMRLMPGFLCKSDPKSLSPCRRLLFPFCLALLASLFPACRLQC